MRGSMDHVSDSLTSSGFNAQGVAVVRYVLVGSKGTSRAAVEGLAHAFDRPLHPRVRFEAYPVPETFEGTTIVREGYGDAKMRFDVYGPDGARQKRRMLRPWDVGEVRIWSNVWTHTKRDFNGAPRDFGNGPFDRCVWFDATKGVLAATVYYSKEGDMGIAMPFFGDNIPSDANQNMLRHETGHVIGLGHCRERMEDGRYCVMQEASEALGETEYRGAHIGVKRTFFDAESPDICVKCVEEVSTGLDLMLASNEAA